jgi:hypothetical protein
VAKNIHARDLVSKVIGLCSMGYEKVENIMTLMRTSKITIDNQCQCDKQLESSGKTKSSVRILETETFEVVMDIVPPEMKFIQFC